MKRLLYACLALSAAVHPAWSLVGEWESFTRLGDIRDLQAYEGALWAATTGGIRRIALDGKPEKVFRNPEGLVDPLHPGPGSHSRRRALGRLRVRDALSPASRPGRLGALRGLLQVRGLDACARGPSSTARPT